MKTSYYGNKSLPPDIVAVRISRGAPRWRTPYKIAGVARSLVPASELMGLHKSDYRAVYIAALESAGVGTIMAELEPFGPDAVLMCFESLHDGTWCHRRIFADWWERKTGGVIAEL